MRKMFKNNDLVFFLGSPGITRDAENNGYEPRGSGFDSCQPHQYRRGSAGQRLLTLLSFWLLQARAHHPGNTLASSSAVTEVFC